ncbi:MAG: mercury methylation ferredoxin HgcB [Thermodesulfobacteriota bacterium]
MHPTYLKDVVTLKLDQEKCTGCGMCLEVCPHEVFKMNTRHVEIQHRDACMECGACSRNCPFDAITVQTGVGCAAAVINAMLGRTDGACCGPGDSGCSTSSSKGTACCG